LDWAMIVPLIQPLVVHFLLSYRIFWYCSKTYYYYYYYYYLWECRRWLWLADISIPAAINNLARSKSV